VSGSSAALASWLSCHDKCPAGVSAISNNWVSSAAVRLLELPPRGQAHNNRSFVSGPAAALFLLEAYNMRQKEIDDENRYLLERQANFRAAAEKVTGLLATHPAVERVMLFGSVASALKKEVPRFREFRRRGIAVWHECADVDLAVWVDDLACLPQLNKMRSRAVQGTFVAHHQVEIFVMEPRTNRYLGRLCIFGSCPKADKLERLIPGCGATKFLKLLRDFQFYADALSPEKSIVLFQRAGAVVPK
jgi:hypothetical protein